MEELEKLIERAEKEMTQENYNKFMSKTIIKMILIKRHMCKKIIEIEKLFDKYKEH